MVTLDIALVIVLVVDLSFLFFTIILSKRFGLADEKTEKYVSMFYDLAKMLIAGLVGYLAGKGGSI